MGQEMEKLYDPEIFQPVDPRSHWAGKLLIKNSANPQILGFHFIGDQPVAYGDTLVDSEDTTDKNNFPRIIYPGVLRIPWSDKQVYEQPIWIDIQDDNNSTDIEISLNFPIGKLHSSYWRYIETAIRERNSFITQYPELSGINPDWEMTKSRKKYDQSFKITSENEVLPEYTEVPHLTYKIRNTDRQALPDLINHLTHMYEYIYTYLDFTNQVGIDALIETADYQEQQPPTDLVTAFLEDPRAQRIVRFEDEKFWTKSLRSVLPNICEAKMRLTHAQPEVILEISHQFILKEDLVVFVWDNSIPFEMFAWDKYDRISERNNPFPGLDHSWRNQPPTRDYKNILGSYFSLYYDDLVRLRQAGWVDWQIAQVIMDSAINFTQDIRNNLK
jgi:hypothetical protein